MLLKQRAESALCSLGASKLARRRNRSRTIIIAYHNIVPSGEPVHGDASLHLPQSEFAAQLELLARTHEVISLSDIARTGHSSRPRAVITFDDAYAGALRAGVEELGKRSLPATVFVAPAFVGSNSFWWDAVAAAGILTDRVRESALTELAGDDAAIRRAVGGVADDALPWHQLAATQADLASAEATGLIALGSHSWSHRNLARLSDDEITQELQQPLQWLRQRFKRVADWISYPYGLSNANVERLASGLGYEGGLLISGGYLSAEWAVNRFRAPRLNVPAGVSRRGFELRTAGLLDR